MHQRTRSGARSKEIHDQVQSLRMQDRRCLKIFARRRRSRQDKDSRTDDGADPERRQRPGSQRFTEPVLRVLRLQDQFVDGFATERLPIRSTNNAVGGLNS